MAFQTHFVISTLHYSSLRSYNGFLLEGGKGKTFGVNRNIFPITFVSHSTTVPGFSRKPQNFIAHHNIFYNKTYSNF